MEAELELPGIFLRVATAAALGLLVGIQRERSATDVGGVRTFTLTTVFGAICGLLSRVLDSWALAAGILAVTAMLLIENYRFVHMEKEPFEATLASEMAALVMFGVGAYLVLGEALLAVAMGGAVALLLHWKEPLHGFAKKIGDRDVKAIMQFALVALVILPVLPNYTFGPYDVFNPFEVWLIVVLIVAINLSGYISMRVFGSRAGAILAGLLGGLISGIATAFSYAKQAASVPGRSSFAAVVIVVSASVVFFRTAFEIAVIAPDNFWALALPVLAMAVCLSLLSGVVCLTGKEEAVELPQHKNPAELKVAVAFALFYTLVLYAVSIGKEIFGVKGLFLVAALSGFTDMDAITVASSQLLVQGKLAVETAWKLILVASISNLITKVVLIAAIGTARLRTVVLPVLGISLLAAFAILHFWSSDFISSHINPPKIPDKKLEILSGHEGGFPVQERQSSSIETDFAKFDFIVTGRQVNAQV